MTTRVNLLPWREMRRKEQDRQLLSIGVFAWMLMGLVIFYAHLHVSGMIEGQNNRNAYLQAEIKKLDKVIKEIADIKKQRAALIERMNVIYKLQGDRTRIVHLMDEIVQTLPEGVFYSSLVQKGNNLVLKGSAQSNARVSALMRNFDTSPWFSEPSLKVVQARGKGGERTSNFDMTVNQLSTPKKASEPTVQAGTKK